MGTTITGSPSWTSVTSPNPAEPVRAGAGLGSPIVLAGANVNGGVSYTALVAGVRVRQLGGIGGTLAVSVAGLDITVQLGTDGAGVVTSTAADVVIAINGEPAAAALVTVASTGTGMGLAGVWSGWTPIGESSLGSVRTPLQALLNRSEWLRVAARADLEASLIPQATLDVKAASVTVAGLGATGFYTSSTKSETVLSTLAAGFYSVAGPFNASAWNYVYVYNSAGNIAAEVSTTAPESQLVFKTGDVTRRYIGAFYADGSGVPVAPGRQVRGRMVFDVPQAAGGTDATGSWITETIGASVIPSWVRVVDLRCTLLVTISGGGTEAAQSLLLRRTGTSQTGASITRTGTVTANTALAVAPVSFALDDSLRFDWKAAAPNPGNVIQAAFVVEGYST